MFEDIHLYQAKMMSRNTKKKKYNSDYILLNRDVEQKKEKKRYKYICMLQHLVQNERSAGEKRGQY